MTRRRRTGRHTCGATCDLYLHGTIRSVCTGMYSSPNECRWKRDRLKVESRKIVDRELIPL